MGRDHQPPSNPRAPVLHLAKLLQHALQWLQRLLREALYTSLVVHRSIPWTWGLSFHEVREIWILFSALTIQTSQQIWNSHRRIRLSILSTSFNNKPRQPVIERYLDRALQQVGRTHFTIVTCRSVPLHPPLFEHSNRPVLFPCSSEQNPYKSCPSQHWMSVKQTALTRLPSSRLFLSPSEAPWCLLYQNHSHSIPTRHTKDLPNTMVSNTLSLATRILSSS